MKTKLLILLSLTLGLFMSASYASTVTIKVYPTAQGEQNSSIGTIVATDTPYGLKLTPHLTDLPPGIHGFHIHQNPSCANAGMAAGGHLDPLGTDKHLGPYNDKGHLGDLPVLIVNQNGEANLPLLAPRLNVGDLLNHSIMIHAGGDNYSDQPAKLGGGGARLACGVIPATAEETNG